MFAVTSIDRGTGPEGALTAAAGWVESLLLGEVGTVVAISAIAAIGLAMLQGRLSPRDGIRVVLGCFVLFGAPMVAKGLADLASQTSAPPPAPVEIPSPPPAAVPAPPPPNPDPYAGASVPM